MVVEYHLFLSIISVVINDFGDFCTIFVSLPRSLSPKLLDLSLAHVLAISLLVMASCYYIFSLSISPHLFGDNLNIFSHDHIYLFMFLLCPFFYIFFILMEASARIYFFVVCALEIFKGSPQINK